MEREINNDETIKKINEVIDRLRPFLINDGGNVEFVKFENGIVYLKFHGACNHCPMMDLTLKNGFEEALINEVEGVIEVRNID